ncbi:hypothetical protein CONPUDRAFT_117715 [Coniophora puteana RWD-64-598 SS2]|uniref:Uncharacterized protein n=1 Tax=Coniophora puteana (strain RWD-64-598) TaxID=741705 RepID=A0A5M3N176_CONPW|nr:uncharacterized protein CONPUDRAFT_117715 [Coniophora puteana RWD-64-598 SS2]EIW85149.1 hypothetical protein CONPUDRAFT_117715 [Coniophora puteana RWD-64-598 SS2]
MSTLRHTANSLRPLVSHKRSFSSFDVTALDKWIGSKDSIKLQLQDTFRTEHLSDLFITLPTRDGTRKPSTLPRSGDLLLPGHHLAFFHPRNPEAALRPDGTDADFCPPEPFTRRMWAGGSMRWNKSNPLLVGEKASSISTTEAIDKKGFDQGTPMVFVKQKIEVTMADQTTPSLTEERSHVYLASAGSKRANRGVSGLPKPNFSFGFTPTLTTLFRFSALTFNGHHIHLDKDYAQKYEGYPERLVHGPLTALMLLEVANFHNPAREPEFFEYRARNPVIVDRPMTFYGAWTSQSRLDLWCADDDGTVGMTGYITYG